MYMKPHRINQNPMNDSSDNKFDPEIIDSLAEASDSANITHDQFVTIINENYGRYIRKSYGYLKCKSLAEDAVQEGILSAYKKKDTVRHAKALPNWIGRIITNKAIDSLRKNKRLPDFHANLDDIISYNSSGLLNAPLWSETSTPEQDILKKETLETLNKAIENLDDVYRIPFLLKDYEEFSVKEIAEILEISESNVKVRIHRARIKIKLKFDTLFYPKQTRGTHHD